MILCASDRTKHPMTLLSPRVFSTLSRYSTYLKDKIQTHKQDIQFCIVSYIPSSSLARTSNCERHEFLGNWDEVLGLDSIRERRKKA